MHYRLIWQYLSNTIARHHCPQHGRCPDLPLQAEHEEARSIFTIRDAPGRNFRAGAMTSMGSVYTDGIKEPVFLFFCSVFSFCLVITGYLGIWGPWALVFLEISSKHEHLWVLADVTLMNKHVSKLKAPLPLHPRAFSKQLQLSYLSQQLLGLCA